MGCAKRGFSRAISSRLKFPLVERMSWRGLPRGTPRVRKRAVSIFYYINILCSILVEKASCQLHVKGMSFHHIPP
jgi:hypothetical protein